MSRSRAALPAIIAAAALLAHPVGAQSTPEAVTAEAAVERADQAYTVASGPPCNPNGTPGEIVVCGDTGEDQRLGTQSTSTDIGGGLRPPDLAPKYPGIVVARGCFIPPCPPPQPLIIDIAAIPVAPRGSDADLIGRGELRAD